MLLVKVLFKKKRILFKRIIWCTSVFQFFLYIIAELDANVLIFHCTMSTVINILWYSAENVNTSMHNVRTWSDTISKILQHLQMSFKWIKFSWFSFFFLCRSGIRRLWQMVRNREVSQLRIFQEYSLHFYSLIKILMLL